ncbi:hypothetical protein CEUSTIGMA_g787.t1 [Chlamydomonas eustigma]|uniref:Uncharacterized protein n=1 Tax=Chlamydomonas eustigma TaxID=1157962 RepID=A0A250WR90_9CHLO|nr:hypothetical protein CEUSTIGMA_g787.t1 [Chlamydomonas eustigma]|eukprot:GAX73333.1 hypothetical protein CEUSTIGMA_g787.t1 [Chlamydomonas eustigma]
MALRMEEMRQKAYLREAEAIKRIVQHMSHLRTRSRHLLASGSFLEGDEADLIMKDIQAMEERHSIVLQEVQQKVKQVKKEEEDKVEAEEARLAENLPKQERPKSKSKSWYKELRMILNRQVAEGQNEQPQFSSTSLPAHGLGRITFPEADRDSGSVENRHEATETHTMRYRSMQELINAVGKMVTLDDHNIWKFKGDREGAGSEFSMGWSDEEEHEGKKRVRRKANGGSARKAGRAQSSASKKTEKKQSSMKRQSSSRPTTATRPRSSFVTSVPRFSDRPSSRVKNRSMSSRERSEGEMKVLETNLSFKEAKKKIRKDREGKGGRQSDVASSVRGEVSMVPKNKEITTDGEGEGEAHDGEKTFYISKPDKEEWTEEESIGEEYEKDEDEEEEEEVEEDEHHGGQGVKVHQGAGAEGRSNRMPSAFLALSQQDPHLHSGMRTVNQVHNTVFSTLLGMAHYKHLIPDLKPSKWEIQAEAKLEAARIAAETEAAANVAAKKAEEDAERLMRQLQSLPSCLETRYLPTATFVRRTRPSEGGMTDFGSSRGPSQSGVMDLMRQTGYSTQHVVRQSPAAFGHDEDRPHFSLIAKDKFQGPHHTHPDQGKGHSKLSVTADSSQHVQAYNNIIQLPGQSLQLPLFASVPPFLAFIPESSFSQASGGTVHRMPGLFQEASRGNGHSLDHLHRLHQEASKGTWTHLDYPHGLNPEVSKGSRKSLDSHPLSSSEFCLGPSVSYRSPHTTSAATLQATSVKGGSPSFPVKAATASLPFGQAHGGHLIKGLSSESSHMNRQCFSSNKQASVAALGTSGRSTLTLLPRTCFPVMLRSASGPASAPLPENRQEKTQQQHVLVALPMVVSSIGSKALGTAPLPRRTGTSHPVGSVPHRSPHQSKQRISNHHPLVMDRSSSLKTSGFRSSLPNLIHAPGGNSWGGTGEDKRPQRLSANASSFLSQLIETANNHHSLPQIGELTRPSCYSTKTWTGGVMTIDGLDSYETQAPAMWTASSAQNRPKLKASRDVLSLISDPVFDL